MITTSTGCGIDSAQVEALEPAENALHAGPDLAPLLLERLELSGELGDATAGLAELRLQAIAFGREGRVPGDDIVHPAFKNSQGLKAHESMIFNNRFSGLYALPLAVFKRHPSPPPG